ncbi:hypothetical protein IV454_00035 [Massilia antarctica]|uniref:Uncharacterized protein n=1 Tax=Massilia antarctica TaxID=2765360 RepID=A0AA48WDQ3_9BURK|nr:hypothetical protein [Massilia antarctica]QPI50076.1 hypothetical protein IV454_00035 [Massilia antarctica]
MGLYYLALLLIWFGVLWWVVKGLTWRLDHRYKRLISLIVIVIVYPLPLADEIIGAIQFSKLCEHQVIYKDPDMEKKRGARLIFDPHEKRQIEGKALPMTSELWEFVNESDKSVMLSYVVFNTGQAGDAFDSTCPAQRGRSPLIFSGVCYPKEDKNLYIYYKIVN